MKKISLILILILIPTIAFAWMTANTVCVPGLEIKNEYLIMAQTGCKTWGNDGCCWALLKRPGTEPKSITGCYFKTKGECFEYLAPKMVEWFKANRPEYVEAAEAERDKVFVQYGIGVEDPDSSVAKPQCNDEEDNDNDFKIDLADPGCSSPDDNSEADNIVPDPIEPSADCSTCQQSLVTCQGSLASEQNKLERIESILKEQ